MQPLEKSLRKKLEDTVKEARDIVEVAARAALEQLGVGEAAPYNHLSDPERELRRKLRAHGRQLGDVRNGKTETQEIDRLIEEVAYEHWHRMLFARFLAENNLLMYPDPDDPVAVTLEECEDLAADEGAKNGWELASRFAARMLPQIFRPDSPVFQLELPPEHQQKLERFVAELSPEVFTASDSLGWVYQFWQAKKKDEVNASEVKIGARELPAVTQLFTEPYMVAFLLDNSLGAWWASRRLTVADFRNAQSEEELRRKAALPGVPLEYLRFVKVARPSRSAPCLDEHTLSISEGENLPHWTCDRAVYHVCFRLADSVPQSKRNEWIHERESIIENARRLQRDLTAEEEKNIRHLYSERIEKYLDAGYGDCLLARPEIAELVASALKHFNGERYLLHAWCVMPNHVHVIVEPVTGWELSKIIHSWKSFTAHEANKRLNRSGDFWQRDAYNHIIRSEKEYFFQVQYTWENPDKAGLRDWVWRSKDPDRDGLATTWTPAAGTFVGWPEHLSELRTLDPCCGSGHFLVAAFLMLVAMRMELEGLSACDAVDAVIRENLHGLEIDQRCVELAAFALALTAWRYPEAGGYRTLPEMNLACSGLSVSVAKEEWKQLALNKHNLRIALDWMYDVFKDAPLLGSLLNPAKTDASKIVSWNELSEAIAKGLEKQNGDEERREARVVAHGLAKAATLLSEKYHWVITNVPYLARGKQSEFLRDYCEKYYPAAKNDLATVFLGRCLQFCEGDRGAHSLKPAAGYDYHFGTVSIVLPQNWLFLTTYKKFREKLLKQDTWHLITRLGPSAFQTPMWDFNVQLLTLSRGNKEKAFAHTIAGLDVSDLRTAAEKASGLLIAEIKVIEQAKQLENPNTTVALEELHDEDLLVEFAESVKGLTTGDVPRFIRYFSEFEYITSGWEYFQTTPKQTSDFDGMSQVFLWEGGVGAMQEVPGSRTYARGAWGTHGVLLSQMGNLPATRYFGVAYDNNCAVIKPINIKHLAAFWVFCASSEFNELVRKIDQSIKPTNATFERIPFDLDHWTRVAKEDYPNGLPEPYSDAPTQWIFHGHPCGSVVWDEEKKRTAIGPLRIDATVLQVAVARLLGYRWPAEFDEEKMELSDEALAWVKRSVGLLSLADNDGIVCIPPVRGEASATDRLLNLLATAHAEAWSNDRLSELLKQADHTGKSLETWLRDKYFSQHGALFHHRPFIWQIWDGLRDGFAALLNYHKLDRKNLETLIYTYLGDWISRQKQDIANGVEGAEEKLAAAENLKKRLELILEGEAPYDIFVRWKSIEKQPIGWDPDLNDGVRINIRPFLSVPDVGKRGAGVLRDKPNINWNKDRGKDVPSAPWYHLGPQFGGNEGDRLNDHHLTIEEKLAVRKRKGD